MPKIIYFDAVSSTLDKAHELAAKGELQVWDSVLARSQWAGRGQMRKKWQSPSGNLYAAIRLPLVPPFDSSAAAINVALLIAPVLKSLGVNCLIKWPNDLVIIQGGIVKKVAGILLEEKDGALIAGIGINIHTPEKMDEPLALPGIGLEEVMDNAPCAEDLWRSIMEYCRSLDFSATDWRDRVAPYLLWLNERIVIYDDGDSLQGWFRGLDQAGGALLETERGDRVFYSGSMRAQ